MAQRYTLKQLEAMPTLSEGHFSDIKIETDDTRVSLSRMTVEDGADYDHQVIVEQYQDVEQKRPDGTTYTSKMWVTVEEYQASISDTLNEEENEIVSTIENYPYLYEEKLWQYSSDDLQQYIQKDKTFPTEFYTSWAQAKYEWKNVNWDRLLEYLKEE